MRQNRKASLQKELKQILKILKDKFYPERVILFGSLLGKRVSGKSDIDLLIIKKTKDPVFERTPRLEQLLRRKYAADLIVLTPSEVKEMTKAGNPYLLDILENGKILYEAAA